MSTSRKALIVQEATVSDPYESEAAAALNRVADMAELIAGGLFALAAGVHTTNPGDQRNMAAVFAEDARTRFADPLRRMNKRQRTELESYISGLCKAKR